MNKIRHYVLKQTQILIVWFKLIVRKTLPDDLTLQHT